MQTGTALRDIILDQWASLDYKKSFHNGRALTAPTWVGDHARRLQAYMLLQAYRDNVSREWLETTDLEVIANRREYGDAELIVQTIVAAILGNDPTVRVDGAGEMDADAETPKPVDPAADALQEWFDEWVDNERPLLAVNEGEEDSVGMGDGVYVVSWDATKGRPVVTCYDPGFYFPVLDEGIIGDYPTKVHIAWEFERFNPSTGSKNRYVRRMTWELVPLTSVSVDVGEAAPAPTQSLPWNAEPTTLTCLWTDATWHWDALGDRKVEDLSLTNAVFETNADGDPINALDLHIDFLPVVHVPNTVARKLHYGISSLALVLQLLDELISADTDLALSARTTGFPPISVDGTLETLDDGRTVTSYGPGSVFQGKVGIVDTSKSLDALLKYIESLLSRISTNTRLPESLLGRIKPSEVPSGIALSLSFGPLRAMITKMRMVRDEKYPLLFKFVARFAMQDGQIPANTSLPAVRLDFGAYIPQDPAGVITYVTAAVQAKIISRLTAVQVLIQDAGMPIEDAISEVDRIEHEDFTGAAMLANALADEEPVYKYLDITPPKRVKDGWNTPPPTVDPVTGLPMPPDNPPPEPSPPEGAP